MKTEFSQAAANAPWINHTWATSWALPCFAGRCWCLQWLMKAPCATIALLTFGFQSQLIAEGWLESGGVSVSSSIFFTVLADSFKNNLFPPVCSIFCAPFLVGFSIDSNFTMPVSVTCKVLLKDESRSKPHVNRFFVSEWQLLTWRCVLPHSQKAAKGLIGERLCERYCT